MIGCIIISQKEVIMTVINAAWLEKNTKEPIGLASGLMQYSSTSAGSFRLMQLANKTIKAWGSVVKELSPSLQTAKEVTGKGLDALGLISVPGDTVDGYKAVAALADQSNTQPLSRKVINVVKDAGGAVASCHYAATLFTQNPAVAQVAKAFDFSSTVADLTNHVNDHAASKALLDKAQTAAIKKAINASKHYYFLSIMKNVSSIGLFVISYLGLICRAFILAPAAIAFLSLGATIVALKRDLYKTNMLYNLITFNQNVDVTE